MPVLFSMLQFLSLICVLVLRLGVFLLYLECKAPYSSDLVESRTQELNSTLWIIKISGLHIKLGTLCVYKISAEISPEIPNRTRRALMQHEEMLGFKFSICSQSSVKWLD